MNMQPHVHANLEFQDLDVTGLDLVGDYHVAYRFGEVGEEPFDTISPYLPLSISFGPPKLGPSRFTMRYGLVRDFWASIEGPNDDDREALLRSAQETLGEDIRAVEQSGAERLKTRRFLRIATPSPGS